MNRIVSVFCFLCFTLWAALFTPSAHAMTYYVATTGSDKNPGTTAANPFLTISKAVYISGSGDTVLVADGTYTGVKNGNVDFGGKDRTVQSASGVPVNCIIDCQQSGCAFTLKTGETQASLISGFTIKNGTGFKSSNGTVYGGGIYMTTSNPVVSNCILTNNSAPYGYGGGMYGGTATACTFTNNSAYYSGGGIYQGTATNCIFTNNSATYSYGGGMSGGTATNCTFTNNSATGAGSYGGGMSGGTATNCTFTGNAATGNDGSGGGMSGGTATNCTFTNNSVTGAGSYGGGMSGGTATNCTFTGNAATGNGGSGGGMSGGTATNCTFTNNKGGGMSGIATNCMFINNAGGGMAYGTATNSTFIGNSAEEGGGMFSSTATNCTFIGNSAEEGGGMFSSTATNCTFIGNLAMGFNGSGGGMEFGTATNCTFIGNSSISYNGGGGMAYGTATNCTFIGNSAKYDGGGVYDGAATNCIFTNNSAPFGGGMNGGTATNCVFSENAATQYTSGSTTTPGKGGGVDGTNLYFCTVVGNSAQGTGGGIYLNSTTVTDCVVWGNTAGMSGNNIGGSNGTATYNDTQDGYAGTGNINTDPLFVNPSTGNLHLSADSPCIDAGTTTAPSGFTFPPTDLDGGKRIIGPAPDMGAYEVGNVGAIGTLKFNGIAANAPPQTVSFQFRPTGGGTTINQTYYTTSDGAFYLYGVPNGSYNLWVKSPTYLAVLVPITVTGSIASIAATLQPGDANNDNVVDTTDFNTLINAFGGTGYDPATGYDPTADFDGDGNIDTTDFNLLIGSFGNSGAP